MGWTLVDDDPPVVTAAALPPIPKSATRWTNQLAEAAYRRGLAEGQRGAINHAVRAATAAAAPARVPQPKARQPGTTPRPATTRPAPKRAAPYNPITWIAD